MEDTETEGEESDNESSDTQSHSEEDYDDDNEVFVPTDVDREFLLVSRCCCYARRMRFNKIDQ